MANRSEWFMAQHGVSQAGGASVLVNPSWKRDEVRHALELTRPVGVIADGPMAEVVASTGLPVTHRVCVDDGGPAGLCPRCRRHRIDRKSSFGWYAGRRSRSTSRAIRVELSALPERVCVLAAVYCRCCMANACPASELDRLAAEFGWSIGERAHLADGVWHVDGSVQSAFDGWLHQELLAIEDSSLWFRWRNALIWHALAAVGTPEALWDVGAGNGVVAKYLQSNGITTVAIEPGRSGARSAARRGVGEVVCASLEDLYLPGESLPAVGVFDVLEHLERPDALLEQVHRVVRPGGLLAVTVPAFPALWSDVDVVSGHCRRYRRPELKRLLERSGFDVVYLSYQFVAAVPPLAILRTLPWRLGRKRNSDVALRKAVGQVGPRPHGLEALGDAVMHAEAKFCGHFSLPLGTSIMAVARRPPSPPQRRR
jgi:SAM-dependent methyltransferase